MRIDIRSWLPLIAAAGLCAVALSWRAGAVGAAGSRAPQTSVAVVDLELLLRGLAEFKDHEVRLQRKADELRAQLDERRAQLRVMVEERDELPAGSEARLTKVMEGLRLQATINAEGEAWESWLAMEQARVLKQMFGKAEEAVETIAARDGWDVVLWDHDSNRALSLERPEAAEYFEALNRLLVGRTVAFEAMNRLIIGRTVAYWSPRADITQLVVDTMNNAYAAGQ